MVKFGAAGIDSSFPADVLPMDRMTLLRELAADIGFKNTLASVDLTNCTVFVLPVQVVGDEPTDMDEAKATELKGIHTIKDLLESASPRVLYIRVMLPGVANLKVDSGTFDFC